MNGFLEQSKLPRVDAIERDSDPLRQNPKPETTPAAEPTRSFVQTAEARRPKTCPPWDEATLRGIAKEVATAPEGQRNDTLNRCAFTAARKLVASGRVDEAMVIEALTDAARRAGLDDREIGPTIASGLRAGNGAGPLPTAPASATNAEPDGTRLWRANDLKPAAPPRWLAKSRLPRAAISLLVGDEGIGKSLLWVWIVAAVTTGKELPGFDIPARDRAHVIVIVTEDDWSTTVRPRLEVAGADLDMVSVICASDDGSGVPVFPRDLHLITEADPAPALVVVDCWLDTVPGTLSVRNPQQARQALHLWKDAATATDAAVLLLTHTNRVASGNARERYGATGELRKKARMTLYAQTDDDGHLVVGPEKANTTATVPASAFTITSVQHFQATVDSDGTVPKLVYTGESNRTAREHILDAYENERIDREDRTAAEQWLKDYLMMNPGSKSADVKAEAKKAGIADSALRRAREKLRVEISNTAITPRITTWTLPDHAKTSPRH